MDNQLLTYFTTFIGLNKKTSHELCYKLSVPISTAFYELLNPIKIIVLCYYSLRAICTIAI